MPTTEHRWIVDAVAEEVARIEVDGGAVVHVPRWLLPSDAREGEVLRVTHARTGARSRVEIERDPEATRQAIERSAARVAPPAASAEGADDPRARGDIEL